MRRRTLLAVLGAGSLSLAGCLATTPSATEPDEPTTTDGVVAERPPPQSPGETFETSDGRSVTVHDAWVQRSVVTTGVHTDVAAVSDRQFVVADVTVTGDDAVDGERSHQLTRQFRVSLDGTDYPQDEHVLRVAERDRAPTGTLLGFPVPVEQVDHPAVVWQDGDAPRLRWLLGDDSAERIASAPAFEVRGFEVPETVGREETFEATLTVANVGDRDGTFLAELGSAAISDTPELSVDVPASETVTHDVDVDPYVREGMDEVTLVLDRGSDEQKRTVAVED